MAIVEFLIFVISSGLFCSERFRHNIYAVLIAGGIATASSLLFVYHLGTMWTVHAVAEPVKVVKQIVRVPVIQKITQAPSLSKPENCHNDYPFLSRLFGQEGTTGLDFKVLADGTVNDVKVAQSSGSDRLDDAAVHCVAKWHYRPGIKDGQLVDMAWTASVVWNLHPDEAAKDTDKKDGDKDPGKPADDTAKGANAPGH